MLLGELNKAHNGMSSHKTQIVSILGQPLRWSLQCVYRRFWTCSGGDVSPNQNKRSITLWCAPVKRWLGSVVMTNIVRVILLECLFRCSRVSIPWSSPTLTIMIIHYLLIFVLCTFWRRGTLLSNSVPDCRKFFDFLFKTTSYIVFNLSMFSIYFLLMKINIFNKQLLNDLYILLVFTLFILSVFFVYTR